MVRRPVGPTATENRLRVDCAASKGGWRSRLRGRHPNAPNRGEYPISSEGDWSCLKSNGCQFGSHWPHRSPGQRNELHPQPEQDPRQPHRTVDPHDQPRIQCVTEGRLADFAEPFDNLRIPSHVKGLSRGVRRYLNRGASGHPESLPDSLGVGDACTAERSNFGTLLNLSDASRRRCGDTGYSRGRRCTRAKWACRRSGRR